MDGATTAQRQGEAITSFASPPIGTTAQTLPFPRRRSLALSESIVTGLVRLADAVVFLAVATALYLFYLGFDPGTVQTYAAVAIFQLGLNLVLMQNAALYEFNTIVAWPNRMRHLVTLFGLVALLLVAAAFALRVSGQFSRVWFFSTVVCGAMATFAVRGVGRMMIGHLARSGKLVRNMAIVGASGQAQHLVARLREHEVPWKRIIGIFDDRRTRVAREIDGFPVLGNLDDLVGYVRRGRIQDVVITLPWSADERLVNIISRMRQLPVNIYLGSDLIGYHFPRHRELLLDGVPVMQIAPAPLTGWSGIVKWVEDKAVAVLALALLSPLMLLIALAIKLDSPGPVFFRQKRYGFNNQLIEVWKFRSMYHHLRDDNAARLTEKNDPRVTRVGAFLRRTSLDELPQLINVLKGQMSVVGPRPHALLAKAGGRLYEDVVAEYAVRHKVKPGISGWAQVKGWRGETDVPEKILNRVEHDLFYIENWSLWLDVKILLMTVWVAVTGRNAY